VLMRLQQERFCLLMDTLTQWGQKNQMSKGPFIISIQIEILTQVFISGFIPEMSYGGKLIVASINI